jgi:hypothetical protein
MLWTFHCRRGCVVDAACTEVGMADIALILGDIDAHEDFLHHGPVPVLWGPLQRPQSTIQGDTRESERLPRRQTGSITPEVIGMPSAATA